MVALRTRGTRGRARTTPPDDPNPTSAGATLSGGLRSFEHRLRPLLGPSRCGGETRVFSSPVPHHGGRPVVRASWGRGRPFVQCEPARWLAIVACMSVPCAGRRSRRARPNPGEGAVVRPIRGGLSRMGAPVRPYQQAPLIPPLRGLPFSAPLSPGSPVARIVAPAPPEERVPPQQRFLLEPRLFKHAPRREVVGKGHRPHSFGAEFSE